MGQEGDPQECAQAQASSLTIVSGSPNSSVKNLWVGSLHMLTHMPTHPLACRYLHFSILTPTIIGSGSRPGKATSLRSSVIGPTSHRKNTVVIHALISRLLLLSGKSFLRGVKGAGNAATR